MDVPDMVMVLHVAVPGGGQRQRGRKGPRAARLQRPTETIARLATQVCPCLGHSVGGRPGGKGGERVGVLRSRRLTKCRFEEGHARVDGLGVDEGVQDCTADNKLPC